MAVSCRSRLDKIEATPAKSGPSPVGLKVPAPGLISGLGQFHSTIRRDLGEASLGPKAQADVYSILGGAESVSRLECSALADPHTEFPSPKVRSHMLTIP